MTREIKFGGRSSHTYPKILAEMKSSQPKVYIRKSNSGDDWHELPPLKEDGLDFTHAATLDTPAVQNPTKCNCLHANTEPKTLTFHVNLDERKRRELLNLFYDKKTRRAERCLKDGIRILDMWQREKEPHRKAYYWHISELKLTRALGDEPLLHFMLNRKPYILAKDMHGKVRIYKNED